ncbi:MAG: carbon monoxide dehydrogenase subunit [Herminiimonas sp.]|nr:carbon monoxide dehydrogenase subunit [Herminiimonas sp.]
MEIKGTQTIPAKRTVVWDALNDPEVLQKCLPGCESVERVSPEEFRVLIAAAIGPLRARFKGTLRLTEANPPASCVMVFEGQGGAIGFGKGTSTVNLVETAEGTELSYTANAQVGGKLAQVGSRLIDNVARKMSDDFFAAFKKRFSPVEEAPAAEPAVAQSQIQTAAEAGAVPGESAQSEKGQASLANPTHAVPGRAMPTTSASRPAAAPLAGAASGVYLVPAWWMSVAAVLGAAIAIAAANLIR